MNRLRAEYNAAVQVPRLLRVACDEHTATPHELPGVIVHVAGYASCQARQHERPLVYLDVADEAW